MPHRKAVRGVNNLGNKLYLAGERGASVDKAGVIGDPALMAAALNGHLELVRYLAGERGASVAAATMATLSTTFAVPRTGTVGEGPGRISPSTSSR